MRDTRKIIMLGDSKCVTIPSTLQTGEKCTLAASRLIIIDPRGEIPPEKLEEFLEKVVDPIFWKWYQDLKLNNSLTV